MPFIRFWWRSESSNFQTYIQQIVLSQFYSPAASTSFNKSWQCSCTSVCHQITCFCH